MRIALALIAIAVPAAADNHVTVVSADLLVAPGIKESRVVMGRYGLPHVEVETIRMDFIDVYDDSLFDVRGSFLGAGFRFMRPRWGFTAGAHLVTVWTDSYRYITPFGALRIGAIDDVHATFEAHSQGAYAAAVGEPPGRALMRDFDLEARLVTPGRWGRWELRGRYRDIDVGQTHLRDAMVCTGFRLAFASKNVAWLPAFVGLGIRQERWRDEEAPMMGDVVVGPARSPTWETLLWFELDVGAEGPLWPK